VPKLQFNEKQVKWLLSLAALSYVIFHFTQLSDFSLNFLTSIPWNLSNLIFILCLICLTFVNWSIEAYKWKVAMDPVFKLRFGKSLKGILCGLTVAIFTPNRSGEFVGRIFVIPKRYRLHAISSTIFANVFQLSITLLMGTLSLIIFTKQFSAPLTFTLRNVPFYSIIIGLTVTLILLLIYRFRKRLFELHHVISQLWRYFKKFSFKTILILWSFSLVRYFVFMLQFRLILNILNVDISFQDMFLGLSLTYYAMALLPIITLAEPLARSSLSLVFFSNFTQQSSEILIAILLLWIVNLVIPSVLGTILMNYSNKEHD